VKGSRLAILLVAVLAVVGVAVLSGGGGDDDGGGGGAGEPPKTVPKDAVEVTFHYSPEKEPLLAPLIDEFNGSGATVGGRQVFVNAEPASSGDDETKLAKGRLQLTAWSPASSLWGRLLNYEADKAYVADSNPSIVRTPLVIAMWEPMAQTLGYPGKKLGFGDILALAKDPKGWEAYGRPEFGAFKLVHTNPDFSTSGLSAVVAEYYAATGKLEGLTEDDVTKSAARAKVKDIERSIVHYGDTTLFIADQLRKIGMAYASAVAMEEVTLNDFNKDRGGQPKLVPIFPKEGTFYSDSPFIVLNAPWVTPEQREGAQAFQRFLAEKITPEVARRAGFRSPEDDSLPTRVLALPEPKVLARIKETWRADRKPANVLLVVDTSGSMAEEDKLVQAKRGLELFLNEVARQDNVGLTAFSSEIQPLVPIAPIAQNRERLQEVVQGLIADGETRLFDATAEGVDTVKKLVDASRINAVVVLTDGVDTNSSRPPEDLIAELAAGSEASNHVRVFTIAYGQGAAGSENVLKEIAAASGGKDYTGSTEDIESVYRSISSFF
jgi:Ca-activated chloride channel family protein